MSLIKMLIWVWSQIWFVADSINLSPHCTRFEIGVIFYFYNYYYVSLKCLDGDYIAVKLCNGCCCWLEHYLFRLSVISCSAICAWSISCHIYMLTNAKEDAVFQSVLPFFRFYAAQVIWSCITAVLHALYVDIKSHLSPVWSCCVNRSLTPPTSTHPLTARPSSADTAWTWSSPTATRGNTHPHTHKQMLSIYLYKGNYIH